MWCISKVPSYTCIHYTLSSFLRPGRPPYKPLSLGYIVNSTYASAWTAVQYFFFSNWSPIEAYYTVLQYDSSVLYVLMSPDPVRRFALQLKSSPNMMLPFVSKCLQKLKASRTSIYVVTCEGTMDSHFHVSILLEMVY
jgi:hypothetical protein